MAEVFLGDHQGNDVPKQPSQPAVIFLIFELFSQFGGFPEEPPTHFSTTPAEIRHQSRMSVTIQYIFKAVLYP